MLFIGFLTIGLLARWLAGVLSKGSGFGFWGNLGVGVGGAPLGAVLLLGLVGLVKRKYQKPSCSFTA